MAIGFFTIGLKVEYLNTFFDLHPDPIEAG